MKRLLRIESVLDATGLSRSRLYEKMKAGEFPLSVPIGERNKGWVESEVDDWIDKQIAKRDEVSSGDAA